jgi:pimeloyl-ACP methyl ester carboxylesterase
MSGFLIVSFGVGIGLWLVSHLVEVLRRTPQTPEALCWARDIPISYIEVGGNRLRYIKVGTGPILVLLHTLRTQLDLFQKLVPELAKQFTVVALDYPGHGYSDIPEAPYDADFFAQAVDGFLDILNLRDATLVGVSIGGAISLILAGRRNPRVGRVIAVNAYDYGKGRGMARSSPLGWMITMASQVPVLGETIMRFRNFAIMRAVLRGGVTNRDSIPPALLREMYEVGNRRGHYRAFVRLLRNAETWEAATRRYENINVPVCLIWGAKDWSEPSEREHDRSLIPSARVATIENGGHFLPLDRPKELQDLIIGLGCG